MADGLEDLHEGLLRRAVVVVEVDPGHHPDGLQPTLDLSGGDERLAELELGAGVFGVRVDRGLRSGEVLAAREGELGPEFRDASVRGVRLLEPVEGRGGAVGVTRLRLTCS
ncbi:MAG: hypothetical protein MK291_09090 [Planctomycetes bacterium]|nr:hypothetical protein [Planctomycetota bacterium]